ncbi:alpha/beta fold hydrolase [Dactylosporangium aurantiacum]|uniref:Alpha/beta fold hydrolase n=2 Tax=Dactylosporangium aurantiacum TaxID=35754 RepID=A0A9Q9ITK5_9ACTN|nr:alpha/beta fold hydrolase [Dactylosporangium aurantiacum]UWZ58723.1 alpha/beta fold hydrolase [Dactylosporangium aurantiacum]
MASSALATFGGRTARAPHGCRRTPRRARTWYNERMLRARLTLALGLVLVAAGVIGFAMADRGLRIESARVGPVPLQLFRPVDDAHGAARPVVVVAHGYAGSGRLMRPFADTLARRGYLVALPDLAGHGANPERLTEQALDRELAAVVRFVRALPDADPARVALVGHSMGAAAVVRVGAADQTIAATVAISIGDDASAAVRPGPRHLLGIYGAFEPAGIGVSERATGADRVVAVPLVEHIGVLFADRTHHETARWLDRVLNHSPERSVIAAKGRLIPGGLTLLGGLLTVVGTLLLRRTATARAPLDRDRLGLRLGAVLVAPVLGELAGVALTYALPNTVTGYLTGYLAGCGSALAVAALLIRRPPRPARPALTSVGGAALLAVVTLAVVVLPVHVGLTDVVPHGPDWWVIAVLALAVGALLAGAHALLPTPWDSGAVLALCLPMPVASLIGAAPGFLALISPLIMVLIVLHLAVYAAAGRPWWQTIPAGALTVAWPVAVVLPVLGR